MYCSQLFIRFRKFSSEVTNIVPALELRQCKCDLSTLGRKKQIPFLESSVLVSSKVLGWTSGPTSSILPGKSNHKQNQNDIYDKHKVLVDLWMARISRGVLNMAALSFSEKNVWRDQIWYVFVFPLQTNIWGQNVITLWFSIKSCVRNDVQYDTKSWVSCHHSIMGDNSPSSQKYFL